MSTFPDHWHVKPPFLMVEDLLSISPACCGQLVKMLITLESHGIFGSHFAYLFILILSGHLYENENNDKGMTSIILDGQGFFFNEKKLVTLEPLGIF